MGPKLPDYDFSSPRLFVDANLAADARIALSREQSHYLLSVLRMGEGEGVLVFNGRDGEWSGRIAMDGKRACRLIPVDRTRPQTPVLPLWYAFAPLKSARLDYLVQKAVEMGATRLLPVLTRHTQMRKPNLDRMRANAVEASEQCGILSIAEIDDPRSFDAFVAEMQRLGATIVFCDEDADVSDPLRALRAAGDAGFAPDRPLCVLVGPEGGFDAGERLGLLGLAHMIRLPLGPRILRADTAAVAALALVQATLGDWRNGAG